VEVPVPGHDGLDVLGRVRRHAQRVELVEVGVAGQLAGELGGGRLDDLAEPEDLPDIGQGDGRDLIPEPGAVIRPSAVSRASASRTGLRPSPVEATSSFWVTSADGASSQRTIMRWIRR
jgi:hypothetical protein